MIDIKEVTEGKIDGNDIWICDLRYNDYSKRPIRIVRPTLVRVIPNSQTKKRVYYSESCFAVIKNNGTLSNKIIVPFDTTGNRSYTGIPLNCFDSKDECVLFYKKQVKEAVKGLKAHRLEITEIIDDKILELNK